MNLRPNTINFSCVLQMLLLSLLMTTLLASSEESTGAAEDRHIELRCMCVNVISGIHPSNIQKLNVIRAGPHCAQVEVIATLKDGNEVCLDPEAPRIKKIVQKILEGDGPTN
ncbi:platelet basic protein-like [Suncus etruscus]|uniref:platelet basic protein-like n=1 Tax=Suncus etruscus TaxID=109475 RepID=UPI0021108AF2|nr:platelet basic protein-like [Suncus etruscus]